MHTSSLIAILSIMLPLGSSAILPSRNVGTESNALLQGRAVRYKIANTANGGLFSDYKPADWDEIYKISENEGVVTYSNIPPSTKRDTNSIERVEAKRESNTDDIPDVDLETTALNYAKSHPELFPKAGPVDNAVEKRWPDWSDIYASCIACIGTVQVSLQADDTKTAAQKVTAALWACNGMGYCRGTLREAYKVDFDFDFAPYDAYETAADQAGWTEDWY